MKKLCPREAVFIGLLVMVPLLMFVLVIKPRYDSQKKMTKMAKGISATCSEFGNIRPLAVNRLQEDKKALNKLVEDTRKRLPEDGGFSGILHGLAQMAQENNLILKDVKPVSRGPEKKPDTHYQGYGTQWIDIKLEGSFEGLYNFLIALEDYERIILIDNMDLKLTKPAKPEKNDKTADVKISAELGLVVYYHKTPENGEGHK